MSFFTHLNIRAFVGRHSRLRLMPQQWNDLIAELGRRAGGVRESGAFLLADSQSGAQATTVKRFVYFDDIEPTSLIGTISMSSSAFSTLWDICNAEKMRVIADVHTHPETLVRQSDTDRKNPMIASAGHVAVIVPYLAGRAISPHECGVHLYRGAHRWDSGYGRDAARLLYIGRWA